MHLYGSRTYIVAAGSHHISSISLSEDEDLSSLRRGCILFFIGNFDFIFFISTFSLSSCSSLTRRASTEHWDCSGGVLSRNCCRFMIRTFLCQFGSFLDPSRNLLMLLIHEQGVSLSGNLHSSFKVLFLHTFLQGRITALYLVCEVKLLAHFCLFLQAQLSNICSNSLPTSA